MNVVLFETNREILYVALATTNGPLNEFGDLILQCKNLLLNRSDFVVLHVRRPTNIVCS